MNLEEVFRYHPPTDVQIPHYEEIRKAGHRFAQVVVNNTPAGADQTAAVRKIREAVMTANAAIALGGQI